MALKLVITTRTEKQFDTLVTLGSHLKARLKWLVKREYGTVILQSAKVNFILGFQIASVDFETWSYFHYIMSRGFESTSLGKLNVSFNYNFAQDIPPQLSKRITSWKFLIQQQNELARNFGSLQIIITIIVIMIGLGLADRKGVLWRKRLNADVSPKGRKLSAI